MRNGKTKQDQNNI